MKLRQGCFHFILPPSSLLSIVRARLRAQALDARAARLLFERALACGARAARRDSFGGTAAAPRELRAELRQTGHLVAVLAALLAARDDDARGQVTEADSRLHLVDVLPAGAARTEGLDLTLAQQLFVRLPQPSQCFRRRAHPLTSRRPDLHFL